MINESTHTKTSAQPPSIHEQTVQRYFDNNSAYWSAVYERVDHVNDAVLTHRKDFSVDTICSTLEKGSLVLDAGCGAGFTAVDLLLAGYHVDGFDISQKMIALCEQNVLRHNIPSEAFRFLHTDHQDAEFETESYQAIVALGFLQYQSDEDLTLQRFYRLLQPGGILVISGPMRYKLSNGFGIVSSLKKLLKVQPPLTKEAQEILAISLHNYSVGLFRTLLERSGFKLVRYHGHGFVHIPLISERLALRRQLFLNRIFNGVARYTPLGRWGNDLIMVAKKQ